MFLRTITLVGLIWASYTQATIVTRQSIASVLDEITDARTLVIFDIDDTLVKANGQLTEATIPDLLKDLKSRSLKVIALTARPWASRERTLKQLAGLGISFSESAITCVPMSFNTHVEHPRMSGGYTDGIIFCGWNPKGTMLAIHLLVAEHRPSSIVFIDDIRSFIDSVDQVCARLHIPCTCIHYCPRGGLTIG